MNAPDEQLAASHAVYTRRNLRRYDGWVIHLSNRWIWRCPSPYIERWYDRHVSDNHLDVGVGTGYYLDRCRFRSKQPRLALLDASGDSLSWASHRLRHLQPTTFHRNVLEPLELGQGTDRFDSVGITYLLHCLPGTISCKAIVLDHLVEWMTDRSVLFGATILGSDARRNWLARSLMNFYNEHNIFSNRADELSDLQNALRHRFQSVSIERRGCVTLFSAGRSSSTPL